MTHYLSEQHKPLSKGTKQPKKGYSTTTMLSQNPKPFDAKAFEIQHSIDFQLRETRETIEKIKAKAPNATNISELGYQHGKNGEKPILPEFGNYWRAFCLGYREFLLGHTNF